MAGGSADAAGMLVGLDRLMGTGFSLEELCGIGVKIGADVPFCLVGGAALVKGIGEKITPSLPFGTDGWWRQSLRSGSKLPAALPGTMR